MIQPDFIRYSLTLIHDDRIVYTSDQAGLQPLVDCLAACRDYRNCTLHDRVFGLAAARLITPTEIVKTVVTRTISSRALTFLEAYQIEVQADEVVESILTKDRSQTCPAEVIALETDDLETFRERLMATLGK